MFENTSIVIPSHGAPQCCIIRKTDWLLRPPPCFLMEKARHHPLRHRNFSAAITDVQFLQKSRFGKMWYNCFLRFLESEWKCQRMAWRIRGRQKKRRERRMSREEGEYLVFYKKSGMRGILLFSNHYSNGSLSKFTPSGFVS